MICIEETRNFKGGIMGNRRFWHIALFLLLLTFISLVLFTEGHVSF